MSEQKKDGFLKQVFITQTKGFLDVSRKRGLWQEIADEWNGKLTIGHTAGNELEILKLVIPYKNREIHLSESDTRPLKFEISFECKMDYELTIGQEDAIEKILKKLGKKEVEVGNEQFDNKYLVQSPNPELTKQLLTKDITDLFVKLEIYSSAYATDEKMQTSHLVSVISRTLDDKSIFIELIGMHERIMDQLEEFGVIG
jgi:hypothetical protein